MRKFKRLGALVALSLLAGLLVPGQAKAATTYEVQVAQSFFEMGVPGFSARIYPGSIKVQPGDTIHFSDHLAMLPAGEYPQNYIAEDLWRLDSGVGFLVNDPDDGADAVKFGPEDLTACGTQDNPCSWGANTETLFAEWPEEDGPDADYSIYVTIDALPGTVLWGNSIAGSDINSNIKVEVVAPNETASTQAELDARAAQLLRKDFEDAVALHNKMNAKRTSHRNAQGQKVYDIFVGAVGGPLEFFASYPKKITVPRGARVMYHFAGEAEPHTATFGGPNARDLMFNGIMPVCDPDGDEGAGPDTEPNFGPDGPPCVPPAELELDVDNRVLNEVGNGRVGGRSDLENSGLKAPVFPQETSYNASPWTVRMTKTTNAKGLKYICLLHGGFMGGRVRVR